MCANFIISAAIAVKAVLWHMQENLAPHRWWKLGKSLEIYVFRRCYILHVLLICPWVKAHNLQHPSLQVCCDECQIWVHVECDLTCINMEVICFFCFDVYIFYPIV